MVKLKGPGLAQDASGSLGGVLVFSSSKGRAYAKKLTAPKQPRPAVQVSSRAALAFLTERWSTLNGLQQATWGSVEQHADLDDYRRFISENIRTWHVGQPPSKQYPATRTAAFYTITNWDAAAQGRRTEHGIRATPHNSGWGVIMMRHTAPLSPVHFNYAIRVINLTIVGWNYFWDGPLAPDTYYYRLYHFTIDGRLSSISSQRTVVIT